MAPVVEEHLHAATLVAVCGLDDTLMIHGILVWVNAESVVRWLGVRERVTLDGFLTCLHFEAICAGRCIRTRHQAVVTRDASIAPVCTETQESVAAPCQPLQVQNERDVV